MRRYISMTAHSLFLFVCLHGAFTVAQNPVAFVNQPLVPTSVAPGHGAFTLTVNGTGFTPGATVDWNGEARATTRVSSSQLQAAITASDVAQANTAAITVVNPGGVGPSNVVYFPVGASSATAAFAAVNVPLPAGTQFTAFTAITVGDFNNDGKLDIAYTTGDATINVLLGNGDGTFQPPIQTVFNIEITGLVCYGIGALVPGNFNGDSNLDLAFVYGCGDGFAEAGYPVLFTALGAGDGTFTLAGNETEYGTPTAAADFNGDGYLDVTAAYQIDPPTWYYKTVEGAGNGNFVNNGGGLRIESDPTLFVALAIGDFNHDGKLDIAAPENYYDEPAMSVLLGDGKGGFEGPITYVTHWDELNKTASAAAGDLNGDGNLDVVADSFSVFLGNGDGTFRLNGGYFLNNANNIQLADFNNDNKLDAVFTATGNSFEPYVGLLQGNGDGTFQEPQAWGVPNTVFESIAGVGDFNGSGKLGFLVVGSENEVDTLSLFLPTTLAISPSLLDFGEVWMGTSKTLTATLTNTGQTDESIGSIEIRDQRGVDFTESNNCGPSLAPGASCAITVTLKPTADHPSIFLYGSMRISYGGALGSPQYIELAGWLCDSRENAC
jgi:hypothetical protein